MWLIFGKRMKRSISALFWLAVYTDDKASSIETLDKIMIEFARTKEARRRVVQSCSQTRAEQS